MGGRYYNRMNNIVLLIGAIFSPIAALMAFIITYEEYKHHFPEFKISVKKALGISLITLLVFLVLSFLISIIINKII